MIVRTGDLDRGHVTVWLVLEKRIYHFSIKDLTPEVVFEISASVFRVP
jgi:hypothetical protein